MARTITNPAASSSESSATIRSELQTLETEVADTSSGHDHDGSDSKTLTTATPTSITDNTSASTGSASTYSRSDHVHAVGAGVLPFKSGDWIISTVTTARDGWTNVSATYSDKFMRINATPLTTGGADTHTHSAGSYAGPSHTHTGTTDGGNNGVNDQGATNTPPNSNDDHHFHTFTTAAGGTGAVTGTSASANNIPVFVQVVTFQKS